MFAYNVKVTKSNGEGLRWVAEEEFDSEAAAEGIKEGGVGRGAESARDVGCEGSVFDVGDRRGGGVDG